MGNFVTMSDSQAVNNNELLGWISPRYFFIGRQLKSVTAVPGKGGQWKIRLSMQGIGCPCGGRSKGAECVFGKFRRNFGEKGKR